MNLKRIIAVCLALPMTLMLFAQQVSTIAPDVLVKTDGVTILSKVLRVGEDIEYKKWDYLEGPTYHLPKADVARINYGDGRTDTFNSQRPISDVETTAVPEGSHVVGPGETLSSIASRYNTSEAALKEANPQMASGIYDGMLLTIPSLKKEEPKYKSGIYLSMGAGWILLPKEEREVLDRNWFFNVGMGNDTRFDDSPVFLSIPFFDFSWYWTRGKGAEKANKTFMYVWPFQIGFGDKVGNFRIGGLIGGETVRIPNMDPKSFFVSGLRFSLNLGVDASFQLLWIGENEKPIKTLSLSVRF